ncbi:putative protease SohB, partial [Haemophilus influenzae]|jgi:hypothetical protein
MEFL